MNDAINLLKKELTKLEETFEGLDLPRMELVLGKVKRPDAFIKIQTFLEKKGDFINFDYSPLPEETIKKFRNSVGGAGDALKHISAQVNASKEISTGIDQNSLVSHIRQFEEKSTDTIMEFLRFLSFTSYLTKFSVDSIALDTKAAIIKSKDELFSWIKEQRAEMAKSIGTAKYSHIFVEESNRYRRNANWWLFATVLMLALTLMFAIYLLLNFGQISGTSEVVQLTVTKIIVATALFYSINMCLKSYRAQKHNQIINQHRHNALQTFEVFQKVSTDEQTKNAVLLEVTRTIFGNQQTGYTSTAESDGENIHSKIVEITKLGSK